MATTPQTPHVPPGSDSPGMLGSMLGLVRRWLGSGARDAVHEVAHEEGIPHGVDGVTTDGEHSGGGGGTGETPDATTEFELKAINARLSTLDQRLKARRAFAQRRAEVFGERAGHQDGVSGGT